MSYIENARKLRAAIDSAGAMLTDEQALSVKDIYQQWQNLIGTQVSTEGFKFLYGADLYKLISVPHTFAAQWVPGEGTESLYARIDEGHAGTIDDPIPYDGNMELFEGLYYIQSGVIYLCTRGTGAPVYHALADLVGLYVEVANG